MGTDLEAADSVWRLVFFEPCMERERIDLLHGAIDGMIAGAGRNLPRSDEIAVDLRFLSAADVTGTTGMAFGLWPAWRASQPPLALNMQTAGRGSAGPCSSRFAAAYASSRDLVPASTSSSAGSHLGTVRPLHRGKIYSAIERCVSASGVGSGFGLRLPSRGRVRHLDPERHAQLVPRSFSAPGGPASAWTGFTLHHLPTTNLP
jgi:hypothetical protein